MSVSEASLEPKEARLPLNASEGKKRRTKSHAANAIKRFYGYPSDRKGKEAKEKEASNWALKCKNRDFVVDERVIIRLESWKLEI